jgi:ATP-binding cassette subfamily F protein 3
MLQISDLIYRIEGRDILAGATATVPSGHKIGLVGRNGAGKTTLLRLIAGELSPDGGEIVRSKGHRLGYVRQEAPGGDETLIEWVLSADTERARLMAEAETASDPDRIAEIQIRLGDIGAFSAHARAAQLLAGLGFDEVAQQMPCRAFSGGWRMRVALAAVLFLEPELLLLDEPTNYLDLEGAMWLESYLRHYPHTVIMVSHDRDLLNRAVNQILHLSRGGLTLYQGGYDAFEDVRRARQEQQIRLKAQQDRARERIEGFVNRFRAQANKARQAQSRLKALERMKPVVTEADEVTAPITFSDPEKQLASPIIRLERVSVGYAPGQPVLSGLDLRIDHDDRIALLGQNGNGKSTFAKLIAGRLVPETGERHTNRQLKVGYFAQHQLDELEAGRTPYQYITRLMPEAREAERRARLGAFGFGVEKADTAVAALSGGEKARLLLMLTAFQAPHLMILDEPTNHLDVDSRELLIQALNAYDGAVLLISHDRHLIDATADRLWLVENGQVGAFDGDMAAYRERLLKSRSGREAERTGPDGSGRGDGAAVSRADQRRLNAEMRAQLAPLKREVNRAEKALDKEHARLERLDAALAEPDIYLNEKEKAQALMLERGQVAKRIEALEEAWLKAAEAHEKAAGVTA